MFKLLLGFCLVFLVRNPNPPATPELEGNVDHAGGDEVDEVRLPRLPQREVQVVLQLRRRGAVLHQPHLQLGLAARPGPRGGRWDTSGGRAMDVHVHRQVKISDAGRLLGEKNCRVASAPRRRTLLSALNK